MVQMHKNNHKIYFRQESKITWIKSNIMCKIPLVMAVTL
jgi:hypothetical protein